MSGARADREWWDLVSGAMGEDLRPGVLRRYVAGVRASWFGADDPRPPLVLVDCCEKCDHAVEEQGQPTIAEDVRRWWAKRRGRKVPRRSCGSSARMGHASTRCGCRSRFHSRATR